MVNQRSNIISTQEFREKNKKPKVGACIWKWKDVHSKLMDETSTVSSGSSGSISLVNADVGDGILPGLNASVQVLKAGKDNNVHSHRHSMLAIFVVYQGEGYSIIDGEKIEWEKGDVVVAPPWLDHGHCNTSETEDAILLNIQDIPRVSDMGLWFIEEPEDESPRHIIEE